MKVIEQNTKKEIDWSKGGQLVVSKNGEYVVTSGASSNICFGGTNLSDGKSYDNWLKERFELVVSPVTFVNE